MLDCEVSVFARSGFEANNIPLWFMREVPCWFDPAKVRIKWPLKLSVLSLQRRFIRSGNKVKSRIYFINSQCYFRQLWRTLLAKQNWRIYNKFVTHQVFHSNDCHLAERNCHLCVYRVSVFLRRLYSSCMAKLQAFQFVVFEPVKLIFNINLFRIGFDCRPTGSLIYLYSIFISLFC